MTIEFRPPAPGREPALRALFTQAWNRRTASVVASSYSPFTSASANRPVAFSIS